VKLALSAVGIVACVLIVACSDDPQNYAALGMENEELREDIAEAHSALELFTRNEGSCAVRDGGPRIFCWMVNSTVYRRELEPSEYIAFRSERRKKP
jgi:hypothetical protein